MVRHSQTVKVRSGRGNVSGSGNTDVTGPTTPTLTATAAGSTAISLYWTASTDASGVSGYELYRSTDNATWGSPIYTGAVRLSSNPYSDTGRTASTTYYYQVRAYDPYTNYSGYGQASATTSDAGQAVSSSILTYTTFANRSNTTQWPGGVDTTTAYWRSDYHKPTYYPTAAADTSRGYGVRLEGSGREVRFISAPNPPAYGGGLAARFTLSAADSPRCEHIITDPNVGSVGWTAGREHYIGWSQYLDPAFPTSGFNLAVLHQGPHTKAADDDQIKTVCGIPLQNSVSPVDTNPCWALRVSDNGQYRMSYEYLTPAWVKDTDAHDIGSFTGDLGAWVRWVVNIFYHPSAGWVKVYKGEGTGPMQLVHTWTGKTGQPYCSTYSRALFEDSYLNPSVKWSDVNNFGLYHWGLYATGWSNVNGPLVWTMDSHRILDSTGNVYTADPLNQVTP